jgi:hypothetical protein
MAAFCYAESEPGRVGSTGTGSNPNRLRRTIMAVINGKRFRRPRHWTLTQYLEGYSTPDATGCRLWRGQLDKDGYGVCRWQNCRKAHRLSWVQANGPIPDGMLVCHRCDTPACINPDHLFLGTDADNRTDMVTKGRRAQQHGERNPYAKLTEDLVRAIRADARAHRAIASSYNVAKSTVGRVKRRDSWGHV